MKDYLIPLSISAMFRTATTLCGCLIVCSLAFPGHVAAAADESEAAASADEQEVAEESAPASKPFQFDIPKSVFITEESADVKDPFFPTSRRRWGRAETGPVQAVVPEEQLVARHVALRGITGFEGSKVALINGKTFMEGDEAPVKLPDDLGQLKLKVLRVYENSVEFVVVGKTNVYRKQLE
ncbi:MAG: hypothetical protein ACO34E_00215 [Limisphaerales bacterium]|jgi:hypothetical protein